MAHAQLGRAIAVGPVAARCGDDRARGSRFARAGRARRPRRAELRDEIARLREQVEAAREASESAQRSAERTASDTPTGTLGAEQQGSAGSGEMIETKDGLMDVAASCAKRLVSLKACDQVPPAARGVCKGIARNAFPCPGA